VQATKKNLTIHDIARLAGVSHTTVSRCLNGSPHVSEKTRAIVAKIVSDVKFQLNTNARALVSRRTDTVAVLYPMNYDDPRNLQYTKLLLHDLQEELANLGFDALMTSKQGRSNGQSNLKRLVSRTKIDGVIMIGDQPDAEEQLVLLESGIPVVLVDPFVDTGKFDVYATNNLVGGSEATHCLLTRGRCRSPITLTLGQDDKIFQQRTKGFERALADHGIAPRGRVVTLEPGSVFDEAFAWVKGNLPYLRDLGVDGIFAQADLIALGAVSALAEHGVTVPAGLRVIGFDDASVGTYFRPRLTTMHQPREEIARAATARLVCLIQSKTALPQVRSLIPPTLILRESC